jgi:hypothetical protein
MRIRRFHSILRRNHPNSSSSLPLAIAVGLVTTSSIGGYYISRSSSTSFELPQAFNHTQRTLNGLTRLGNLITTVGIVCYDYLKIMKSQENVVKKSDPIREKIRVVRLEHEKLALQLYQSKNQEERERLQQEILLVVGQLKKLSVEFTAAMEEDPPSPYIEAHERSAIRLHKLCEENGGVYIKLGQHLAQLDYILPLEFVIPLRRLLGDTPHSPKEAVRRFDYPHH